MRVDKYFLTILCISYFFIGNVIAQDIHSNIDSLWERYSIERSVPTKVGLLIKIGENYTLSDKPAQRDSVYDLAVQNSLLNDTLLFYTYQSYFLYDEYNLTTSKAHEYAEEMKSLANNTNKEEWFCRAYIASCKACILLNDMEVAGEYANKAYYYASQAGDVKLKIESMLELGYCKELINKKIEAFRYYSDALFWSEKEDDNSLRFISYGRMAGFYLLLKKYEKSKYYIKHQFEILSQHQPVDSLKLIQVDVNYAQVLYKNNEIDQSEKYIKDILRYSYAHGYYLIKKGAFTLYRACLIENSLFSELRDLYEKQYPEEYRQLAKEDTTLYYRLNGYILEANGKPDSAALYYAMAETRLETKNRGNLPLSNFYKRYGEFLLRHNNEKMAIQKFDSAYKYALAANYFPYLIETTHYLDSLSYLEGNVNDAYRYAGLNKMYSDKQAAVNKNEEMLQLEVENEARQQELRATLDRQATERRYNLQYTAMVIAIIGVFIVLAAFGTFRVHPTYIRILGFFSFIFFFEFIIMIADHQIHDFTHGEPWKFMAFKIVLIAILLPLHHWLEEKVIHYLVHHHMMSAPRLAIKMPRLKKKKEGEAIEEKPSEN